MARYRHYNSRQAKMIAVSYDRQLLPGTFEHALSYLIDHEIDLERFASRFNNDDTGAPAYDSAVLLKIVLFAYSRGITSSCTMARACVEIDGVRDHLSAISAHGAADEAAWLADSGYHSERGLKALADGDIDGCIADGQMRKRDPRYADVSMHKPGSQARFFQPKDFTFDPDQGSCVCPAGQSLKLNSANATINGRQAIVFKGTTATCECCPLRKQCLRKPDVTAVRQMAFFHGAVESQLPNPHCRAMREKIDSDEARAICAHRMGLIEPVFGHIQQRGLRRFTLRGQAKVDTQWKLFAIVHNMAKLQLHGKLAAQASRCPQNTSHAAASSLEIRTSAVDHRRSMNGPQHDRPCRKQESASAVEFLKRERAFSTASTPEVIGANPA